MFLTDPALRHVAAQTGDGWSEHIWRHDTATPGPVGVLAALLHKVTLRYNDNAEQLNRLLDRLGQLASILREVTARYASAPQSDLGRCTTDVVDQLGRRVLLEQLLLHTYQAWRARMPRPRAARTSGTCCCAPGDPTFGVVSLHRFDDTLRLVSPDAEAAAAFAIPYAVRLVGEVTEHGDGRKLTADSNPEHRYLGGGLAYDLPPHDDLVTACRSLLRWWALWHCAA